MKRQDVCRKPGDCPRMSRTMICNNALKNRKLCEYKNCEGETKQNRISLVEVYCMYIG